MFYPGQHVGQLARERVYVGHKHIGKGRLHWCLSSIEQMLPPLLEAAIPPFLVPSSPRRLVSPLFVFHRALTVSQNGFFPLPCGSPLPVPCARRPRSARRR